MKRIWIALIIVCFCAQFTCADETALISKQYKEYYIQDSIDIKESKELLKTMLPDGTWPDINYKSKRRGDWDTRVHLDRLGTLAVAYISPNSPYYHDSQVQKAVERGLDHWIRKDYKNPNWYNQEIGVPQRMLKVFMLMGSTFPDRMLNQALATTLSYTKISMIGQNKVWQSGIVFLRAFFQNDIKTMKVASDSIWSELCVTIKEGIQPDGSFHQHGPQLQFGNYGLSFGESMVEWATILRGTRYAVDGDQLDILRNYLLEGVSVVIWKSGMDLSGCGRQIDVECQVTKGRLVLNQLRRMILIDPENKKRYEDCLNEMKTLIGFKSFYRSDLAVYRCNNWYASVKMSSDRVVGAECVNSENVKGKHLADGVLFIYQTGREYDNIQPLWDWRRLPGTTCDQGDEDLKPHWGSKGGSNFVGSIGSGASGVAAMIYQREKLSARKAWFFDDHSVICLGAGIEGESKGEVVTSVQQSLLSGSVVSSRGELKVGTHTLNQGEWVHHSGIGYYLLQNATLQFGKVEGNWLDLFPTRGDRPVEGRVFNLWVDHGVSPQKQTYSYVLFPQTRSDQMDRVVKRHKAGILSNTKNLQAIQNGKTVHAVFYKPGKLVLDNGKVIEVDEPCLLSLRRKKLLVADPTHNLENVNIVVAGKKMDIEFPKGRYAGRQVDVMLPL